jgi:hypothetical protein
MRAKTFLKLLPVIGMLPIALISCYPDGGLESISDYDVVVTRYNKDYNFGAVQTYAMPDTVVHLIADTTAEDEISREYDELILSTISENMAKLNYQRITEIDTTDPGTKPDVVILVAVAVTKWNGFSYYPGWGGYWGYWPGWGLYPPYYPGYGPGYPGAVVPYSFTTGTIIIDMFEPDDIDPDLEIIPVEWAAGLNGLLGGSGGSSRLSQAIDQAFNQSPYLGAN